MSRSIFVTCATGFFWTGSEEEMKSAMASIDSMASSSPSRSLSSSGRIRPGWKGQCPITYLTDVPGRIEIESDYLILGALNIMLAIQ